MRRIEKDLRLASFKFFDRGNLSLFIPIVSNSLLAHLSFALLYIYMYLAEIAYRKRKIFVLLLWIEVRALCF